MWWNGWSAGSRKGGASRPVMRSWQSTTGPWSTLRLSCITSSTHDYCQTEPRPKNRRGICVTTAVGSAMMKVTSRGKGGVLIRETAMPNHNPRPSAPSWGTLRFLTLCIALVGTTVVAGDTLADEALRPGKAARRQRPTVLTPDEYQVGYVRVQFQKMLFEK